MKKRCVMMTAVLLGLSMTSIAMGATWKNGLAPNENRWWYDDENGSFAQNEWRWLDGNQDGVAECYAFDENGWMYANTTTPDGYQVNGEGAWAVNGVVQTQNVSNQPVNRQTTSASRVLVVYYSMPETDGTDTDSGASRVVRNGQVQGNVEYMATTIRETAGADMFRIQTVQTYPGLHQPLVNQASDELDRNARPALLNHVSNLDEYDIIFVGYPNWWGDMPMPLYSFFDAHNLSGKTIIPFTCHGGSGFAGTVSSIARMEPDATVSSNGYSVERRSVAGDAENLRNWVRSFHLGN